MKTDACTDACYAMPDCAVCGRLKHPRGRDPGLGAANGYCSYECPGYNAPPHAGHLWPSERGEHEKGEDK